MLKNEKLVHRLSVEEKIDLIVSNELYRASSVVNYTFPDFFMSNNPLSKVSDKSSQFPTHKALLHTLNKALIEKVSCIEGIENNIFSSEPFFYFNSTVDKEMLSDDPYLYADYIYHFLSGLKETQATSVYEIRNEVKYKDQINKELGDYPNRHILLKAEPNLYMVNSFEDLEKYKKDNFNNLYIAKANSIQEVFKYINQGVYIIYFKGDKENLKLYLRNAIKEFDLIDGEHKNGYMTDTEYESRIYNGKAVSLEKLNKCCDEYINLLIELDKRKRDSIAESKFKGEDKDYQYDIERHNEILDDVARESIVLLKNDFKTLPIAPTTKIAMIGDCFKNTDYYSELYSHQSDAFKTAFDSVNESIDLVTIGFAHGYMKDMPQDDNLLETASILTKQSDLVLYGMWVKDDEFEIPQTQIDCLNKIYDAKKVPIVAVIYSNKVVDIPFEEKCSAILYVPRCGQSVNKALVEILSGNISPSGKIIESYSNPVNTENNVGLPSYAMINIDKRYPLGYGLSYTTFEYSNLEINEAGVSFTITNTGDYDAYETPQIYVLLGSSLSTLRYPMLKGYEKVFINRGSKAKVFIPFDENTFKYFDETLKVFGIEGGKYKIRVSSNQDVCMLEGELDLVKYLDQKYAFENKDVELDYSTKEEFETNEDKAKNMRCPLKTVVSSLIYVYVFFALYLIKVDYIDELETTNFDMYFLYMTIGYIVLVALLAFVVVYNIVIYKRRKNILSQRECDDITLAKLLNTMETFEVSEKTVYNVTEKPILDKEEEVDETDILVENIIDSNRTNEEKEEVKEEQFQDIVLEVEKEEVKEEVVDISDTTLSLEEIKQHEDEEIRLMEEQDKSNENDFEKYEETVNFDNTQSLSQVCDRLIKYAFDRGLIIELACARSIISNLASSHIIFLSSKTPEYLDDFMIILNEFLGNKTHITEAQDSWTSPFYLAWRKDENGVYQKTEFVNDVYNACRFKNNLNTIVVKNVSMKNVDMYFKEFIDFSNNPQHDSFMQLNKTQSLRIPQNITFLMLPKEDDFMDNMSSSLATGSSVIDVVIRRNQDVKGDIVKPDSISFDYLNELVYEAKKTCYLNEDDYKKLDNLEDELNQKEPFRLGNKLSIAIERYTSSYIDAGGDSIDALDSVVSERIVPLVKSLKCIKDQNNYKQLIAFFEKHFGEENINKTKRAIKYNVSDEI